MKKAVWISFGLSLVLVNLVAWLVYQYSGFYIEMIFRIGLILGITTITSIFVGALVLVNKMDEERPLTRSAHDTTDSRHNSPAPETDQSGENQT
ncbi:MAG: hypothetical protein WDZ76_07065 [Pseudohongiellaceae bacterium]